MEKYELTNPQKSIWFTEEVYKGIPIENIAGSVIINEKVNFTLLDTPGHADFSPEMERTLQVLDVAVLVISAPDRVTSQAKLLFKLLSHYKVPTIIFVNKMDQTDAQGISKDDIMAALKSDLSSHVVDFSGSVSDADTQEEIAVCDDELLGSPLYNGMQVFFGVGGVLIGVA